MDWRAVSRNLAEKYHIRPAELLTMTVAEVAVLAGDGKPRSLSDDEMREHVALVQSLTPRERLEKTLRGEW